MRRASYLLAGLLTLSACAEDPLDTTTEHVVYRHRQISEAAAGDDTIPEARERTHKEYGVFATDDAPVDSPELADTLFNGSRFYFAHIKNMLQIHELKVRNLE